MAFWKNKIPFLRKSSPKAPAPPPISPLPPFNPAVQKFKVECMCSQCGRDISHTYFTSHVMLFDEEGKIRYEDKDLCRCPDCDRVEEARLVVVKDPE